MGELVDVRLTRLVGVNRSEGKAADLRSMMEQRTEAGPEVVDTRRPATVLHTSDCHLGAGPRRDEEVAFECAMALARDEGVEAVLIAGDLFDHTRVSDETLRWAAEQLETLACPVVVIRGNHDVYERRSVHERWMSLAALERVYVIDDHDGRLVEIPGTDVVVWGRAMIEHEPGYRPFAGLPGPPADRWTIATGHGLVLDEDSSDRSSPIFASDLAEVRWDYVALGHVHAYREVRDHPTPVRYPGATATSRAGAPGVVLVDFIPGAGARPRWVALSQPRREFLPGSERQLEPHGER